MWGTHYCVFLFAAVGSWSHCLCFTGVNKGSDVCNFSTYRYTRDKFLFRCKLMPMFLDWYGARRLRRLPTQMLVEMPWLTLMFVEVPQLMRWQSEFMAVFYGNEQKNWCEYSFSTYRSPRNIYLYRYRLMPMFLDWYDGGAYTIFRHGCLSRCLGWHRISRGAPADAMSVWSHGCFVHERAKLRWCK